MVNLSIIVFILINTYNHIVTSDCYSEFIWNVL